MSDNPSETSNSARVASRAHALFSRMKQDRFLRTDHLFAVLLVIEWLAAIVVSVSVSSLAWAGEESRIHVHVWAAIFLGGAVISLPVYLALMCPGSVVTRQVVAVGQMLIVA